MTSARTNFLENHWRRYPSIPTGAEMRWSRLRSVQGATLTTQDGRRLNLADSLHFGPLREIGSKWKRSEVEVVLSPGDWVAWPTQESTTVVQELWLLAPCLTGNALNAKVGRETLFAWSDFQDSIRKFFKNQGFLEAQTPTLVACPGTEPTLEPFRTQWKVGQKSLDMTLPTSPELHLKKMIAMNLGPLFEMKSCFRNGEVSDLHEPEFTMLEWYRPGASLDVIASDAISLIKKLSEDSELKVVRTSIVELFSKLLQVQLKPDFQLKDWLQIAKEALVHVHATDSVSDVFHRLWLEKIEPQLDQESVWIVSGFPPFQAAYARIGEDGWAERFEIYWRGLELANAFHEVNDPVIQRERMLQDLKTKNDLGRVAVAIDDEFLRALEAGMPPCSGIAIGVDRLFMAINHVPTIQYLRLFPSERLLVTEK